MGGNKVKINAGAPTYACDKKGVLISGADPVIFDVALKATVYYIQAGGSCLVKVKAGQGHIVEDGLYTVATSDLKSSRWRNFFNYKKAPRLHQEERVHASKADGIKQPLLSK